MRDGRRQPQRGRIAGTGRLGAAVALLLVAPALGSAGAPGQPAAQTGWQATAAGDLVAFRYRLLDRRGLAGTIAFALPRAALDVSRERFRAYDPDELRRLAAEQLERHTRETVDTLAAQFPNVRFRTDGERGISWTIVAPASERRRRQQVFDEVMDRETAAMRARFPAARIDAEGPGRYRIEAPGADVLHEIERRLSAAQERANAEAAAVADRFRDQAGADSARIRRWLATELEAIERSLDALAETFFAERLYRLGAQGRLLPDYARIARLAADELQPVADGLLDWIRRTGGALNRRAVLDRLLLLTQTIPYDRLEDRASSAGFLPPLQVLAENRGDCDSKSVLFAAIAHRLYPDLPIALVLLPSHAYLALGMSPDPADARIDYRGRTWIVAEPVGPGVPRIGELGGESQRRGEIEGVVRLF